MKQLVVKIYGDVQGVGFRYNAKKKAEELNLAGHVANISDGTVEILAEGLDENLQTFLAWCYNGVKSAKVDKIKEKWRDSSGEYKDFSIKL